MYILNQCIGDSIEALSAVHIIQQLQERELITSGEAGVMAAAVSPQALSLPLPADMKDALRAKILRNMLLEIARKQKETHS